MKNLLKTLLFVAIILAFSCKKDENQNGKSGNVQFAVSFGESIIGNKSVSVNPEPTFIIVSINDSKGDEVYSSEKIELYNFEGSYISKPLALVPGDYELVQFALIDSSNSVIYASPVIGSSKAYLVQQPLPIAFTINTDIVTKLVPEVLSTDESQPEDFGYSTFSFNIVPTLDFLISVFEYNQDSVNFVLTSARISVAFNGEVKYAFDLEPKTNKLTMNKIDGNYILSVSKPGYSVYTDTLLVNELEQYLESPMRVILQKNANSGLVAYYPFDNSSNDIVTNRVSTEINTLYVNEGKFGQAISFNGYNSYLRLNTNFDYAERTIAFWFNASYAPENSVGIMYDNDNVDLNYGLMAFSVGKYNGNVNTLYSVSSVEDTAIITLNSWHFTAITVSAFSMTAKYYIDGQLTGTKNIPEFRKGNPIYGYLVDCAVLGTLYDTARRFYSGSIDEFKVYNVVLSDSEIRELFNTK